MGWTPSPVLHCNISALTAADSNLAASRRKTNRSDRQIQPKSQAPSFPVDLRRFVDMVGLATTAMLSTRRGFNVRIVHCKMPRLAASPTSRLPRKFNCSTVWKASSHRGHRKYGNELQGFAADINDLVLDIGRNDDCHVASKPLYFLP